MRRARRAASFWREKCGQARACQKSVSGHTHVCALWHFFPFSICFGNFDMEYRLQWSNLLIDEDVGG